MTTPSIDLSTLNSLSMNLDVGDVADPALRLAAFQYVYTKLQEIVTDLNAYQQAGAISSIKLADGSIVTVKLADKAVTSEKIADDAVSHEKIKGLIGESKLALDYASGGIAQRVTQLESATKDGEVLAARGGYASLKDRLDAIQPGTKLSFTFTATEGQTVFNLPSGNTYDVGANRLEVYTSGDRLFPGVSFTETSSTQFTLSQGVPAGTLVGVVVQKGAFPITSGHGKQHTKNGSDPILIADISGAQKVIDDVGNLTTLTTNAKTSLVSAINENKANIDAPIQGSKIVDNTITGDKIKVANDADKIGLAALKEEVRQAMAGTTPIGTTPTDGSVTTPKIANGAVTSDKTSYLASVGVLNGNSSVVFDTTAKTITFTSAGARLVTKGQTIIIASKVLDYSTFTTSNYYILYYDTATAALGGVLQSSAFTLPQTAIVFGAFNPILNLVSGFSNYMMDGKQYKLFNSADLPTNYTKGTYAGFPDGIDFNFNSNLIKIKGPAVFECRGVKYFASSVQDLDISSAVNGFYTLYFDPTTGLCGYVSTASSIPSTAFKIATFNKPNGYIEGIRNYYLNGVEYKPLTASSLKTVDYHGFFSGDPSAINFDFSNKRLILGNPQSGGIVHRNARYQIPVQTIDLTAYPGEYYYLTYNVTTARVELVQQGIAIVPDNSIVFASFSPSRKFIFNLESCYVNGKPKNAAVLDNKTTDNYVLDAELDGVYTSPVMDDMSAGTPSPLAGKKAADIYALYDALVAAYPAYVTKELLGNEPTGLPIYKYEFKPAKPGLDTPATKFPKMFLVSGTHSENTGVWCCYQALKQICDNWQNNTLLEALRWNVHFIVVPIVNPWGFNNSQRKNSNGVDLNRNYPTEWVQGAPADSTYGGPTPLSEVEAQFINNIMVNNPDIIYFNDFHNFFVPEDNNYFIWVAGGTLFNINAGKTLISKMSRKWKKERVFLPQDVTSMFGYSSWTPGGSSAAQAAGYGYQSATFEVGQEFFLEPNHKPQTALVIQLGVECFVNWLVLMLKNCTQND